MPCLGKWLTGPPSLSTTTKTTCHHHHHLHCALALRRCAYLRPRRCLRGQLLVCFFLLLRHVCVHLLLRPHGRGHYQGHP